MNAKPKRLRIALLGAGAMGRMHAAAYAQMPEVERLDVPARDADRVRAVTTELMTFDLDFANWLMGKPARVWAAGTGEITALLDYGDRSATIAVSGLMPPGSPFTAGFRALFEQAVFELQQVFRGGPPDIAFTIAVGRTPPQPVDLAGGNPYEIELRRFADCIAGNADPALLDADRAIESLELSLAVQRARR